MTAVWGQAQIDLHADECSDPWVVRSGEGEEWFHCGCGEVENHTPWGIALAELERDCPQVRIP